MQRILVTDDDQAVASVLKRGFSYEGFAVDTAASARERTHCPSCAGADREIPLPGQTRTGFRPRGRPVAAVRAPDRRAGVVPAGGRTAATH
jgi:hypothetical protein